jgi:hypothetical protein
MKTLSKWAKANPVKARWLIAFSHVLVVLNAICLGILLFLSDWELWRLLLPLAANVFFIAYLLYPKKGRKTGLFRHSYVRQKTHDFCLVFSYGLVIALGVTHFFNCEEVPATRQMATQWMSLPSITENAATNTPELFQQLKMKPRELKKQIRHELKQLKKDLRKQGDNAGTEAAKVLLILLTIALALFLGYLITVLACNISCSGNEGLALVVWLGGGALIIFLTILAIRKITQTPAKKDI